MIANGTEGVAPATFEFDTNIRGGREPYTINWDFDDGSEESDEESVVHTFDEAGTYTVTATVIDSVGQIASGSIQITVEEPAEEEEEEETTCDPSYPDVCIPPPPPDLDCSQISERNFEVLPPDPHGFDGNDNDGRGCESGTNQDNNTGSDDPAPDDNTGSDGSDNNSDDTGTPST